MRDTRIGIRRHERKEKLLYGKSITNGRPLAGSEELAIMSSRERHPDIGRQPGPRRGILTRPRGGGLWTSL